MGDKRERGMDHTDLEATTPPGDGLTRSPRLLNISLPRLTMSEGGSHATGEGAKEQSCGQEEGANKEVGDRDPVSVNVNSEPKADVATYAVARRAELEGMEQEAHPCLFIENVLDVIFKHIINQKERDLYGRTYAPRDVRSIRLVCREWKTAMTRLYRQTGKTVTFFNYHYEQWRGGRHAPLTSCLVEFAKTMRSSDMVPVQSYEFKDYIFSRKKLRMFREFFRICGPEAVSLSMDVWFEHAKSNMLELQNPSKVKLLKLKKLKLRISYDREADERYDNHAHGITTLFQFLFTAAKNLLELELSYRPGSPYDDDQPDIVTQQLGMRIAEGIPRTVKHLKLEMVMDESALNNLGEMPSQLVRLDICGVRRRGLQRQTLNKFLQSQASTLKHLIITTGICFEFPRLGELIHLELVYISNASSDIVKVFPKLQCLKIHSMRTEEVFSALLSSVQKPVESLKVLHLPNCVSIAPLIKNVAKSFPCVVELHINPRIDTMEVMREVFTYFDNLVTLNVTLYFDPISSNSNWWESLVSGISESDCARIKLQEFEMENMHELRCRPSLLNLTKLKKLVVESHYQNDMFTDFSAHFIFLGMDNLREIQLPNRIAQFSPRYLGLLRDKLKLILH